MYKTINATMDYRPSWVIGAMDVILSCAIITMAVLLESIALLHLLLSRVLLLLSSSATVATTQLPQLPQ